MKLSDLHNPKAAADLIKDFKRRFSAKVCLSPSKDCKGDIIAAHTLSAQAMLRPIAREGHVYAIEPCLYRPEDGRPAKLALKGIRETSVFNGFCAHHDKLLFSPIEDREFVCAPEQLFAHAYRAVAKESYLKRKQAEGPPDPKVFQKIHGIQEDVALTDEMLLFQAAVLRGAEDIERLKGKMDEIWLNSEWRRLVTLVVPFKSPATIVCSFPFSPSFDFEGKSLQDFENEEQDLDILIVTVLPVGTGGYVLMSSLDTSWKTAKRVVDSWQRQPDLSAALVKLIASHAENFAISPTWFDGISEQARQKFLAVFFENADPTEPRVNVLRGDAVPTEDWHFGQPFQI